MQPTKTSIEAMRTPITSSRVGGLPGVEDVKMDCKAHKVVVKGKDADPLKVVERVQKKSGRKVEFLTPIPKPKPKEPKKVEEEKKLKPEEKKKEEDMSSFD
ncbi:hypothetical protein QJS10_CPA02g00149 [Acorus calamus]|uniref:HMA domain-containing protein n=1 Tax=Acorus calamus TaxID=4465 RepID=A0AAV9FF81_ACOCL|nr:hypothetical protein QJS10_CPA02g00149 [Acorus calamus]